MSLGWLDTSELSFNCLLLLERVQLAWLPGWDLPEEALGVALRANPAVAWFLGHKCPEIAAWVEAAAQKGARCADPQETRRAEQAILARLEDLLVYALDPAIYDAQPFLAWDDHELSDLCDLDGRMVIDVGAGTGRLALAAARAGARTVYAVEPVGNLRRYLLEKARQAGLDGVYALDGLITALPFPAAFSQVTMGGHVFGDEPERELAELERVTQAGGMVILCPGNNDQDNAIHRLLLARGYAWGRFEEPRDGWKRKYWKTLSA